MAMLYLIFMNAICMSKAHNRKAAFTLQVLMHTSDLLTIYIFFVPPIYIDIRLDCYPISVFTLIPAQNYSVGDRLSYATLLTLRL